VREEGQLGDINPLIDIDAVKASVKNLILTNYNERPFQPKLGSNLRALLFEPADRLTAVSIRESIKRVIAQYEPRVDSVTVQILDDSDRNRYHVTIGFRVITIDTEVNISVYLVRLR
jgi:phage baseplate assembly protein W